MFGIFCVVLEFVCYVILFNHIFKHNNYDVMLVLSNDTRKKRNQANAISLSGHIYCFMAELIGLIVFELNTAIGFKAMSMEIMSFLKILEFGIVSVVTVFTTPELRRMMRAS